MRRNYQDFQLCPTDAPQQGKPWTYIKSSGWGYADLGSVGVTGEWGYCNNANLPSAVRRAVMALAAIELLPQIEQTIRPGGVIQLQRGDEMKRWGASGELQTGWQGSVDAAIKRGGYIRQRMSS